MLYLRNNVHPHRLTNFLYKETVTCGTGGGQASGDRVFAVLFSCVYFSLRVVCSSGYLDRIPRIMNRSTMCIAMYSAR